MRWGDPSSHLIGLSPATISPITNIRMKTLSLKTAGPFLLLTFIYFIVGFLTTVNGQCQGPLKIAFLSEATTMRNSLTTLISFAFFLGYLLNSSRTGRMLNLIGYKRTLIRSLIVMVGGLLFYTASAFCAEYAGEAGIVVNGDFVPFGYFVFLMGSFLMGTAAAMLQVVINPYIAAYPLPGTSAVQRMNFTCAVNSFGTTIAPLFVTGIMFAGVPLDGVTASQLTLPFILMTLCIVVTTMTTRRLALPDIEGTRSSSAETDKGTSTGEKNKKRMVVPQSKVWGHNHFLLRGNGGEHWQQHQLARYGTHCQRNCSVACPACHNLLGRFPSRSYGFCLHEKHKTTSDAHHRHAWRHSAHDCRHADGKPLASCLGRAFPFRHVELCVYPGR